jgi:hypothetical protein
MNPVSTTFKRPHKSPWGRAWPAASPFTGGLLCVFFFFSLMSVNPEPAHGEHRVFTLTITDAGTGTQREVRTTLDHLQYPQYRYVRPSETIEIKDTWMCYERNDHTGRLCDPPERPVENAPLVGP